MGSLWRAYQVSPQKMAKDKDKTPPPIVIDRYYFKEDESDYLGPLRQCLHARRQHQDADAVSLRRARFQRSVAELRADVPGAAQPWHSQLIIYPGQNHGLNKPSYLRDRMRRYLDWFGKYLGRRTSNEAPKT